MLRQLFATKFVSFYFGKTVSFFSTQAEVHNTLASHLKINDNIIERLNKMQMDTVIVKVPKKQILDNCAIIRDMDISLEKIEFLRDCLMLNPTIMRNRISILKEMGAKSIGLHHIIRFPRSMRKTVIHFKKYHNIPLEQNVMKSLLSSVGVMDDKIKAQDFNDDMKTSEYFELCLAHYKMFYLELSDHRFHKNRKRKYQSFSEICKLLKLLKTECRLDMEFLKKNPYLLNLDANNVEELLTEFKFVKISGKSIIEIVRRYPRILFQKPNEVKDLLQLYEVLGLPLQSLISHLNILSVNKALFLERYMNVTNKNELALWLKHPRALSMIYRYKSVTNRVAYLRPLNTTMSANINTYLMEKKGFLRFVEGEMHHLAVKKFLLYILRKELGEDKLYVIRAITRHPYWRHIPLVHVEQMLLYLKQDYMVEDICKNIHIVLYPRSKVIEILNLVHEEYSPEKGYNFTPAQYLAVCLYKLEKKYHFSGDAVWQTVHNEISDLSPHCFEDLEDSEIKSDSLVKYINDDENEMLNLSGTAWLEYFLRANGNQQISNSETLESEYSALES